MTCSGHDQRGWNDFAIVYYRCIGRETHLGESQIVLTSTSLGAIFFVCLLSYMIAVIVALQSGKKVVCGDSEGTLLLYHWGLWGDCTDRYPAHSDSIDSLLALGDSVLCTGSSDGTIR